MVRDYYVTVATETKHINYEVPAYTRDDAEEIAKEWFYKATGEYGKITRVKVERDCWDEED